MKKLLLNFLAIIMIVGFSTNLMAQTSATVTGTSAGAVLITAMGLSQTAPMHFGSSVMTNTAGGTIVLSSDDNTRTYGGAGGVATSAATPGATNAAYSVTGTGLETYAITLPTTTTVTHTSSTSGTYTMDITSMLAYVASAGSESLIGTLDAAGDDSFTLGGTLTVQADQTGGIYAGTFNVTVDYN